MPEPYQPTNLDAAIAALRVWSDDLDAVLTAHGDAMCAREMTAWRDARCVPPDAWRLLTWAMGLTCLRGYAKHWHPDLGIGDPRRPCTVSMTWVRFGSLSAAR